ncbi:MAG: hypothetical protein IT422_21695 [Pirellulaceae bacterium]|jgi:hypothetical protein|nr:hypothetical protein [Pirellulaceae bacterium]
MLFSDEELIAYLLGDATAELGQRIDRCLAVDSELLQRLADLRRMLGQIDSPAGRFEPPADLVDTTLELIDQVAAAATTPDNWVADPQSSAVDSGAGAKRPANRVCLSSSQAGPPRRRWLWDSTALSVSLTILCCLALPALLRVRYESRKAQCARNLELTGSELISYALNHPQSRFPFVALEGPEAFAGVYALYLREAGGIISDGQLHCSSLIGMDRPANDRPSASPAPERTNFPSFAELHQLAGDELRLVQQAVGGDYAYSLGVAEGGSPQAPKCQGRSQFAILADAPVMLVSNGNIRNSERKQFIAHEGKGINIFFEDGHVRFLTVKSLSSLDRSVAHMPDNPFENQQGAHEIGLHPQDASLAPSHFAPLGN